MDRGHRGAAKRLPQTIKGSVADKLAVLHQHAFCRSVSLTRKAVECHARLVR
ncbi:MAG TPA: hypothetical protein GXX48_18765 [Ochrobactrum intermedium]|uniref:Uncharacterized protein n=1 Tax=Brucella intermedia TaxID=94625 RepID=A0A7V6PF02_9HYPH|nr:hypothetical protein [Brucella intermedia]HHV69656.1 hypothetical protein [Brucella intermedia]